MKLGESIALRPIVSFIALVVVVLLIPTMVIFIWVFTIKEVENAAKYASHHLHSEALKDIKTAAKFLYPVNSSTLDVARVLSSSLNTTKNSFSVFETKVAPYLFFLFKTLPLAQITYIEPRSFVFSYYFQENQILSMYSDTSSTVQIQNGSIVYNCFSQQVDNYTGMPLGEVHRLNSTFAIDPKWLLEVENSKTVYASLGTGWSETHDQLFFHTVAIDGGGLMSFGFPVKSFSDAVSTVDLHRGDLYLATKDGTLLAHTGPLSIKPDTKSDIVSILLSSNSDQDKRITNISCDPSKDPLRSASLKIGEAIYIVYCAPLEIAGVQSASVLLFPHKGLVSLVHGHSRLTLTLLILMLASVVFSISLFVFLILRTTRREMFLCSALIKQLEATQQAERKSMNKSLAFASASHDVRSSLAALDGLVSLCVAEVAPNSGLYSNLESMRKLASDLLGILNSVLDTSKIEAGKMQLAEEEFDLAQVIEDAVNLYYPTGKNKGIDVVLDPCDSSLLKCSFVKGDRGKLKQILNNLLHNAIKFTSEGHICIRAWAKKPSLENSILASNGVNLWSCLSRFFYRSNEAYKNLSALQTVQPPQNSIEFVIEVDDTGKGIPKEKRKSVFENFVQVKETALEKGGTGLGLGIVQSLVRLMGGEISIVDKELGETGTCFRFNIFLSACPIASATLPEGEETKLLSDPVPNKLHQNSELTIPNQSSRSDSSHVLLFIYGDERRRIIHKFMESLGINVVTLDKLEELFVTLERLQQKWCLTHLSSSGKSELSSLSGHLSNSTSHDITVVTKDVPASASGMDNTSALQKKTSSKSSPRFILIVIDLSAILFSDEQFYKVCSILADFQKDLNDSRSKVVWLHTPNQDFESKRLESEKLANCEHIVMKPFHGSRLYQVLRLLPEFGDASMIQSYNPIDAKAPKKIEESSIAPGPSRELIHIKSDPGTSKSSHSNEHQVAHDINNRPLCGKKILVADDTAISRRIAKVFLDRLGATTEICENGEEAFNLVRKALQENEKEVSKFLPYDYLFMDCEMPVMDGYEATRQIRKLERSYNVHIPIIALTGHEEKTGTKAAGMDFHLTRPLTDSKLLKVIHSLESNRDK